MSEKKCGLCKGESAEVVAGAWLCKVCDRTLCKVGFETECRNCEAVLPEDGGVTAYADGPLFCDEGCLDSWYAEDVGLY